MNEFVIENGILTKYTGAGGNVVIPEGVTEISWNAHLDLRKEDAVTSLVLPKSMADISKCKFRMLQNMESLTFVTGRGEECDNKYKL